MSEISLRFHFFDMPRMARAVVPGVAHHLTQRGVDRQNVFFCDRERDTYLRLAAATLPAFGVRVLAYCLMSNHVHWVIIPASSKELAQAFGLLHGRYAQHMNTVLGRSGHFWQNRFFSCALDDPHTWTAIRYVERNPVRAGLVEGAEQWGWSSAGARLNAAAMPVPLDLKGWRERFTADEWRMLLASDKMGEGEEQLRVNTYTGRPAGGEDFVQSAEMILKRRLKPSKGGRPRKIVSEEGQGRLFAGTGS